METPIKNTTFFRLEAKNESILFQKLKNFGLKPSNISKYFFLDGYWIIFLRKKTYFSPPKSLLCSKNSATVALDLYTYIETFSELIEKERRAEYKTFINEIHTMSLKEREIAGKTILHLKAKRDKEFLGLFYYQLNAIKPLNTKIGSGDIIIISRGEPLKSDLHATVVSIHTFHLIISFEQKPPKWITSERLRIDLAINDVSYQRMLTRLKTLPFITSTKRTLRNILLEHTTPASPKPISFEPHNPNLNKTQKRAVSLALGSDSLFLIHGPPGTGKTTVLLELIYQTLSLGKRILVTADSNTAVDNLLLRLTLTQDITPLRLGHPARIHDSLIPLCLQAQFEAHPKLQHLKSLLKEAQELTDKRNQHSKPTPSRTRGMSLERIKRLAKDQKSTRGISVATMQSMAHWIQCDKSTQEAWDAVRSFEDDLYAEVLNRANIIVSTNIMAGIEKMEHQSFDLVIIDEASQQVEPSTLIAALKAPKVILAGDHKQLPPTVLSNDETLKYSLFERLCDHLPDHQIMLQTQYRMHQSIMQFPNQHFYYGDLIADSGVKEHSLKDLLPTHEYSSLKTGIAPLVLIDTAPLNPKEEQNRHQTSLKNITELQIITSILSPLLSTSLSPNGIGIISPYAAQVQLLKQHLPDSLDIHSIDGFQGQEKEIIILSLVRSNSEGNIGFLKDMRRLNVALTRAKRQLIIIGHLPTLTQDPLYKALFSSLHSTKEHLILDPSMI